MPTISNATSQAAALLSAPDDQHAGMNNSQPEPQKSVHEKHATECIGKKANVVHGNMPLGNTESAMIVGGASHLALSEQALKNVTHEASIFCEKYSKMIEAGNAGTEEIQEMTGKAKAFLSQVLAQTQQFEGAASAFNKL
ncbi:hypothetical protein [Noviherbaspirillum galbum]|uniref:Uncharacterized protein n=1 Tax=Noviherbaspirillum galbum TaxID=2709383 RepID=A0A6B3SU56_9BURK|nr:hypothetical protein [Noviherbaspirillum galbum]NEX64214.1 hypothetical protein [Noviherbaspirillum galbum]